jgi:hypothetical protein
LARVFFGRKAFTPPKAFTATVVSGAEGKWLANSRDPIDGFSADYWLSARASSETGFGEASADSIYDKGDTILFLLSDGATAPHPGGGSV